MESPRSRRVGDSVKLKNVKIIDNELIYLKSVDSKKIVQNVNEILESQLYLISCPYKVFLKMWRETPRLTTEHSQTQTTQYERLVIYLWETLVELYNSCYDDKKTSDVNNLCLRSSWRDLIMSDIESSVYLHENEGAIEISSAVFKRLEQLSSMWLMCLELDGTASAKSKNMLDSFAVVINAIARGVFSTLISCLLEISHVGSELPANSTNSHKQSLDSRLIQLGGASLKRIHEVAKKLLRKNTNARTEARNHLMLVRGFAMTQSEKRCHLPQSLQLKDKGFLFFLKKAFDPFLISVDSKIKENISKGKLQTLGSKLAAVSCPKVKYDKVLEFEFMQVADSIIGENPQKRTFYRMFISKLVHARFNDFMFAQYSEKTPKGGYLLRDKLGTMSRKKSTARIKVITKVPIKKANYVENAVPSFSCKKPKSDTRRVPSQTLPNLKYNVSSQETQDVKMKSPDKRENITIIESSKVPTPPSYKPKSKRLTTKPKKLEDYYH